jgi:hypothetical protein
MLRMPGKCPISVGSGLRRRGLMRDGALVACPRCMGEQLRLPSAGSVHVY